MEVRTQTLDIEKVLEEIWQRLENDVTTSIHISTEINTAYNETYEDGRACKYCLDVLRWCKLISDSECADMQERVDTYIEEQMLIFDDKNRITENKED